MTWRLESGEQQIPGTSYSWYSWQLPLLVAHRRVGQRTTPVSILLPAYLAPASPATASCTFKYVCPAACPMLHAACCMLHAPAYCSCCWCCSLSVAEQPWGSLGRLSRHRVIAHCTNLLCNKFPVLTASSPTPPPSLPLPPLLQLLLLVSLPQPWPCSVFVLTFWR